MANIILSKRSDAGLPWGYIIYRTVYTPESDELWPAVMAKFTGWMHRQIDAECDYTDARIPEKLVHESYKDVVIEDKQQFDGASIDQIRHHFITSNGIEWHNINARLQACLVIDAPALASFAASPELRDWRPLMATPFVGMVDARYDSYSAKEKALYPGYFHVELGDLYFLYIQLTYPVSLDEWVPYAPPELIPVYGLYGYAHDQEGKVTSFRSHRGGRG
ncbi:hypothetical protein BJX61DRAFT_545010 [Aspergillus egyptiacus]|nr:hypothetical protein BJX61DRAFT_545010 [Aspergillus egyptiacus]